MDAVDEELRTLRARAYGPHADIADDPAAIRRLHELEAQRAARRSEPSTPVVTPVGVAIDPTQIGMPVAVTPDPARPGMPEAHEGTSVEPVTELDTLFPAPPEPPAPTADAASASGGPRRYRRRTLWIASATAAALAAGITYAVLSFAPVSASSGAPQISTLAPTNAIEIPTGFIGAAEGAPAFEFHGLTLFLSASGYSGVVSPNAACLMAVGSDQIPATEDFTTDSWSINGPIYSGCEVGVFPGTVEVPLTSDTPEELRAAFPDGIALQFVLDGDRVGVFLDSK